MVLGDDNTYLAPSTKHLNIAKELKDTKHHSIIDKVVICC